MRLIRLHELRALAAAFALAACLADAALAGFDVAVTPIWTSGSNTTSQVWSPMTSSTTVPIAGAPQAPTGGSSNAAGTAGWYDAASPADGAFVIGSPGGDVYSFGAVIAPTALVPGLNLSGSSLNVMVEAQSFGGLIDTNDLTATYTDASGTHSVLASSLASFQYTQVYNDGGIPFGGFGTAYTIDHEWTFALPNDVANLQLSWGWDATSSAIQDLAIFTQSVAATTTSSSWTGGAGTSNWADTGNWTGGVPGATSGTASTASVVLNNVNATNSTPLIDAGRNIQNITFDNSGGNLTAGLTLGTIGGNPLLLSGGGTIQTTASVANPQTINAPLVLEGNYIFTSGAGNSAATLDFGGGITPGATSGTTTLTLAGANSGANTIGGTLADNAGGILAVAKNGTGAWILSGANSFSGGVTITGGSLSVTALGGLGSGPVAIDAADSVTATLSVGASQTVSSLAGTSTGSGHASLAIASGATLAVNQSGDTTFAGLLLNSGTIAKTGGGSLELDGAPTWNNNSRLQATGGTLRMNVNSGAATVGTGVTATVAPAATLELAGSVSALSSGANRVNIVNNSVATGGGLLVSGTHQQVGAVDGTGNLTIDAGSDLTANHVVQSALLIGGTLGGPALLTIAASDSAGKPLLDVATTPLAALNSAAATSLNSLAAAQPFGLDGSNFALLGELGADDVPPSMLASAASLGAADVAGVPEPSSLLLLSTALSVGAGLLAYRRGARRMMHDAHRR